MKAVYLNRKSRVHSSLLVFMIGFFGQACFAQQRGVGVALLDDYVKAISAERARDVSSRKILAAMDDLDTRVQAGRSQLPAGFVERFRRLIDAQRILAKNNRLAPEDETKLRMYVESITAKAPTAKDVIPDLVDAILTEISKLRKLLAS
jgi:hypothetical protein